MGIKQHGPLLCEGIGLSDGEVMKGYSHTYKDSVEDERNETLT